MTSPGEDRAAELRDTIERFCALSQIALSACASQDQAALTAALESREGLTARIAVLSHELAALRRVLHRPSAVAAFDAMLAPAYRAGEQATLINAELGAKAIEFRAELGRQIERLNTDDVGLSAYASAPRADASVIDMTR